MRFPTILDSKAPAIKHIGIVVAEILVAAALLYGAQQIIIKGILYWNGLRGPDSTLYFTMGNAIRRGLTIYRDVFDPKPPGIFLLSAGSLSLFGDGMLAEMFNILILITIPVLFVVVGYSYAKTFDWQKKWIVVQFSVMVGLLLALYHATIGGDIQTEFYGAFFGVVYLVCVDFHVRWHRGGSRTALTTALVIACLSAAACLLLKEPFALTLFASALLLLRTWREWIRLWLIPMITAGVAYIVVLASLGALGSYLTIYLRAMFGNYILAGGGPVWARGLVAWERMFINILDFTPWFILLVIALFLLSLPTLRGKRGRFIGITVTAVCISILLTVRSFFPVQFPWWQLSVGTATMILALSVGAWIASVRGGGFRDFVQRTWRHGLALYLTLTAIGLGSGFHGQYFALAVPVYFALFLLLLRRQTSPHAFSHMTVLGCTAFAAAILLTSQSFTRLQPLTTMIEEIRHNDDQAHADAAALDAILDACGIDWYYYLEGTPLPYSQHAPLNYYLYTRIEHVGRFHPLFFDESFRRLGEAQVIVESKPYVPSPRKGNAMEECIGKRVRSFIAAEFTNSPPACAKNLPMPEGYQLLFRKSLEDHAGPDIFNCKTK